MEERWADMMRAGMRGDARAYHDLLRELACALRAHVRRNLGARQGAAEAEDIVQEVLLALHLKRHTWDQQQPFFPWLRAIARNKTVDSIRLRRLTAFVQIDEFSEILPDESVGDVDTAIDATDALSRLKNRELEIVVAIAMKGDSAREVAQRLGMTEGAVRVALHRALQTLAKTLGAT
jgi:RNA polymerase sigma-70 factor, ECF subfamily